jgi:hypothetical protein
MTKRAPPLLKSGPFEVFVGSDGEDVSQWPDVALMGSKNDNANSLSACVARWLATHQKREHVTLQDDPRRRAEEC